jgi:hypothetical protein
MKKISPLLVIVLLTLTACATSYVAKPLPFKMPSAYPNAQTVDGAVMGARAYTDVKEAEENFGFDIINAGMLPLEVVVDNKSAHSFEINAGQTFLEDQEGRIWPVMSRDLAYDRATKYAQTKETFSAGARSGFFGATAGALIGAAVGVLTGEDVGRAAGKGAAAGGAGGAVLGGSQAYAYGDAKREIMDDLKQKSLETKPIRPNDLAYGFIFFPAEAKTARTLRLHLVEKETGGSHVLSFGLQPPA